MTTDAALMKFAPIKFRHVLRLIFIFLVLFILASYNFLLSHILAELINIIIAVSIFMIAWNSRKFHGHYFLVIIGIAYLFIGALDLIHTITHPEFKIISGSENLSQQLRTAGRYIESFSFIVALWMIGRETKISSIWLSYSIVFLLALFSIFAWQIYPDTFSIKNGATLFKKISDYAAMGMFFLALFLLFKRRKDFSLKIVQLIFLCLIFKVISLSIHTPYIGEYSLTNFLAHSFRFVSFFFLYEALVEGALKEPYELMFRDLAVSNDKLKMAYRELEGMLNMRTEELAQTNLHLARDREHLLETYRQIGVTNRKIPFLLDLYRYQVRKKNRSEAMDYVLNTAMNFSSAGAGMIFRYDAERKNFRLLLSKNIKADQLRNIKIVYGPTNKFLSKILKNHERDHGESSEKGLEILNADNKFGYFLSMPLEIGEKLKGVVLLGFEKKKSLEDLDFDFFDIFALHASQVLASVKIF